jgi:hypothetical protein
MIIEIVMKDEKKLPAEEIYCLQIRGDYEIHHSYGPHDWVVEKVAWVKKTDQVIVIFPAQ